MDANEMEFWMNQCDKPVSAMRELEAKTMQEFNEGWQQAESGKATSAPAPVAESAGALTTELLNVTSADLDEAQDRIAELEAELATVNARLQQAEAALVTLNEINFTCVGYSQISLADFTEECAYVGRRPMEDLLDIAAALAASETEAGKHEDIT